MECVVNVISTKSLSPSEGSVHLDVAVGDAAGVAELQGHQQLLQQPARLHLRQAPALRRQVRGQLSQSSV
jgi:hypothetical protein